MSVRRSSAVADRTLHEQLIKYLTDIHSIEVQALAQMRSAPAIAGDEMLVQAFQTHLQETEGQERRVREALEARGAAPSAVKDLAGRVGGWGMIAFARANPDTPGKLTAHAFSYEHMEIAAYEILERVARRAGDAALAELAGEIAGEERAMADRLAEGFDRAVSASLREKGAEDVHTELVAYLRDAHAIEAQAIQFLQIAVRIAGFEELHRVLGEHLDETREQQRLMTDQLAALGSGPSRFESAAMRIGGLEIGAFFAAQPDTPVKLAGFAFAFEHLEIAAYELLGRVAERAADERCAELAERIAGEERRAAQRIAATWDQAIDVALAELDVSPASGGDR